MKDLMSCNKLMDGVTFVFAGDFRQILPVIPRGTRTDTTKACFKSSPIWNFVKNIYLRKNMKVHLGGENSQFPEHLLKIGNKKMILKKLQEEGEVKVYRSIVSVVNSEYAVHFPGLIWIPFSLSR